MRKDLTEEIYSVFNLWWQKVYSPTPPIQQVVGSRSWSLIWSILEIVNEEVVERLKVEAVIDLNPLRCISKIEY